MIISFFLVGCNKELEPISKDTYMMGTIIQMKVYGKNANKALNSALERISDIENKMSVNISSSDITKINNNSGKESVIVNEDTYIVLEKAVEYSKLTEGAFDATIEPIVKLWGIGTENETVPSQKEISEALNLVNYKDIEITKSNNSIKLKREGQAIDLGGIAKGYAADEINNILTRNDISSAVISLGGNIFVKGHKPSGDLWKIGVQNPLDTRGEYIGIVSAADKSIVSSGNYERYFVKDGKRYHHIFDPKTGYPSEKGVIGTTIISDKSLDGDVLSTSVYVLGLEKGIKLIENLEGIEAIFITEDKKVYTTSGLNDIFQLKNEEFTYEKGR